jgi:hypothetical protein
MPNNFKSAISNGDLRSVRGVSAVVDEVLQDPKRFREIFSLMFDPNAAVRMRAIDAIEKITKIKPELLRPYKKTILSKIATIEQKEVQWHVAQIIPRLELSSRESLEAKSILERYLKASNSNIVRVMSLQAVADLALQGNITKQNVIRGIGEHMSIIKSPSVWARSKKLLKQLQSSRQRKTIQPVGNLLK